ncbi:Rieske (2Fe-2S) protein [Paenibacillus beijingensis]|uniref:2Fe-2S ferredoxin n=1 Tax=Paenibacillus beijingensis TaxID=1126833 RepID=A0A0D5NF01_9BACL|nr:Rieske (2Fe-2S) protein [Paenibacillus beijingensis]AJY73710.1 2Fe-2S ferredoxin [Paenibacillus beijingensis]
MEEITLGAVDAFTAFPAEVQLGNRLYFLLKKEEEYRLVSSICPHAGYTVEVEDGELVCPLHGWSFDTQTGACLNVPSKELAPYDVVVREGRLVALMPA